MTSVSKDVEKRELLQIVEISISTAAIKNNMEDPQKIKNRTIAAILFLGIYPELTKAGS